MARQTSIDAYNEIKSNGLLSKRRWEVYNVLFKQGPMTGREVFSNIPNGFGNTTLARLTELRETGCIKEVGLKKCEVTGMNVILWDVTNRLPKKLVKASKIKCKHCGGKGYFEQEKLL